MFRIEFIAVFARVTIAIVCQAVCFETNPSKAATALLGIRVAASQVPGAASPASTGTELQTAAAQFDPPPMGRPSWNSFSNTVNSDAIQREAKVITSSGLRGLGCQFVNIDEGWWPGTLEPGPRAGDMSNIVKYLHSLGLKAGICTDVGEAGCSFYGPDLGPPVPLRILSR